MRARDPDPVVRIPARYDGLRNDVHYILRTARESWRQDGALVCCLLLPTAVFLYLVLEVLIKFGLFSRVEVHRFLDGHADAAREDGAKLEVVNKQLGEGYHARPTAEGGFVLRKGPSGMATPERQRLLELLGE